MKKLALVGLGPHSKRIYYKFIKNEVNENTLSFSVLIELESKKSDVDMFFLDKKVRPKYILYVNDKNQITPRKLDVTLRKILDELIKKEEITHVVIATEPKAHRIYLDYFIESKIPCLTDKPVIAREGLNYKRSSSILEYKDILNLSRKSFKNKTRVLVQTQRREHPAYKFFFEKTMEVVKEFGVPISYFHIYHSDGTWNMPDDFSSRENHPYKYGYGKLMHSGYHFVDLVAWIVEINKTVSKTICVKTSTEFISPNQQYNQINGEILYKRLFNKNTFFQKNKKLGEVDSYSTITMFKGKKANPDNILSYGTVDLLQSGFSKRSWFKIDKDTYKGNGRFRHEYINLHVGPLFNIQLHSYQSDEVGKTKLFGAGGEEHLDVYIFKNNKLIGGKSFEVFHFGEKLHKQYAKKKSIYLGQNEISRYIIFKQLIDDSPSKVALEDQLLSNKLLSDFYKSFTVYSNP